MKNRKSTTTFASYRLFKLVKFLSESKASVMDIVKYLESIDPDSKTYSPLTVYKYLNTIKALNFELERGKDNKYFLKKLPFTFSFKDTSLYALKYLSVYKDYIEESGVKKDIADLLLRIENRLEYDKTDYYKDLDISKINLPRIYTYVEKTLIKTFEKYIKDSLKIIVSFRENKHTLKRFLANPVDIEYKDNKVYFIVYDVTKGQNIFIDIEKIIEIEQYPQKSIGISLPVTVTYKIRSRLKRVYVLKNYERISNHTDNEAIIVNKGEDKDMLIRRLIGYHDLCKILSPLSYKSAMKDELDAIISNYE